MENHHKHLIQFVFFSSAIVGDFCSNGNFYISIHFVVEMNNCLLGVSSWENSTAKSGFVY